MDTSISKLLILTLYIKQLNCQSNWACPDNSWHQSTAVEGCYKIFTERVTWDEAYRNCLSLGANLLTLETAAEAQDTVVYILNSEGVQFGISSSTWFHIGLRRVEAHRENVIVTGTQGFTWVDGSVITDETSDFITWDEGYFSSTRAHSPRPAAVQGNITNGLWFMSFAESEAWSLSTKQQYICKIGSNLTCGPVLQNDVTLTIRDSRLTPTMCTAVCLNEGYEGFATISKENCWCSNQAIPSPTSSDVCSPSCKSEPWLSCGGEDDSTAVFRALSYFGESATTSKDMLTCKLLYNNGVIRPMKLGNGEQCGVPLENRVDISRDLYCEDPRFFPLRTLCVFVSDEEVALYYDAQFEVCGKKANSDLLVLTKPRINVGVSQFYKQTVKPYNISLETDITILTLTKFVMPRVPFWNKPDLKFVFSGATTHKMSDHPRNVHGSLSLFWPNMRSKPYPHALVMELPLTDNYDPDLERVQTLSLSEPLQNHNLPNESVVMCTDTPGYIGCRDISNMWSELMEQEKIITEFKDPRFLNIYGCIELCRGKGLPNPIAFVTNSSCLCSSKEQGFSLSNVEPNKSLCFSPCPDPSSIQHCPSRSHIARVFDLNSYGSVAVSCRELWENGAYHSGPYMIRTPDNGSGFIQVHCFNLPQTDMGSQVIKGYTILSKGGPPPPWAPQLRPHLFSNNMLDFDGTGFMMTGGEPVLELDLHRLYLVRGLKLLGRGDYDIAGTGALNFPRGYVRMISLHHVGVDGEWTTTQKSIDANLRDEEDLAVIALNRATITRKLKLEVKAYLSEAIVRLELLGQELGSLNEIADTQRLKSETGNHYLGCYITDRNETLMMVHGDTLPYARQHCHMQSQPYVIQDIHEEYGPAEDEILRHRHFHCHPGGRIELDRVSDRCCEEKHHYCHEFYDAFDVQHYYCESPAAIPGYRWTGSNMISGTMKLECKFPPDVAVIERWEQVFTCGSDGRWNADISKPMLPICGEFPSCESASSTFLNAMLPAGIYATGVSVNYTCEELYNWKDGVVGQAFCNDQYQWEVTTLAECIKNECPKYVNGFMNTSDNLHPEYEVTDPQGYNEFRSLSWAFGSYKILRCPTGTALRNGDQITEAFCSSVTEDWILVNGLCSKDEDEAVVLLNAGASSNKEDDSRWMYIPFIILLIAIILLLQGVYVYRTLRGSRRRLQADESKLDAVTVERDSSTKVLVESEKASQLLTIDHNAGNEDSISLPAHRAQTPDVDLESHALTMIVPGTAESRLATKVPDTAESKLETRAALTMRVPDTAKSMLTARTDLSNPSVSRYGSFVDSPGDYEADVDTRFDTNDEVMSLPDKASDNDEGDDYSSMPDSGSLQKPSRKSIDTPAPSIPESPSLVSSVSPSESDTQSIVTSVPPADQESDLSSPTSPSPTPDRPDVLTSSSEEESPDDMTLTEAAPDKEEIKDPIIASTSKLGDGVLTVMKPSKLSQSSYQPSIYDNASKKSSTGDFQDSPKDEEQKPRPPTQTGSRMSVPVASSSEDESPDDVTLTELGPDKEGNEDPIIASHTIPSHKLPIHTNSSYESLPVSKMSSPHITEEPTNQSHQSTHTSEKGAKILLGKRMKRNSVIEEHDNQVTRGTHKPSFASDSLYMYQPEGVEEEEPTENEKNPLQDEPTDGLTLTELDPNKGKIEDPTITSKPTLTVMKTSDSKPSNISGAPELDPEKEVTENPVVASMPALTVRKGTVLKPSNISMAPSVYENAFENDFEESPIDEEQQPPLPPQTGSRMTVPVPPSHDFKDSPKNEEEQPQLSAQAGSRASVPVPSSSKDEHPDNGSITELNPDKEVREDPIIASHTIPSHKLSIHTNSSYESLPVSKMSSPHITEEPTNQSHQSTHTSDKGAKILLGKRMKRNSVIEEHDNQVTRGTHKPSFASDSLYMYQPEGVEEEEPTTENKKNPLQDEPTDDMTLTELDPIKEGIEDPTVTSIPTPTVMKTSDSKPSNISGAPELDPEKEVTENPVVASMPALTVMKGNVLKPSNISMAPSVYENAFENYFEDSPIDEDQQPTPPPQTGTRLSVPTQPSHDFEDSPIDEDQQPTPPPQTGTRTSVPALPSHDYKDSPKNEEQQPQISTQTGSRASVPVPFSSKDEHPDYGGITELNLNKEVREDPIIASHTSPSHKLSIHTNSSYESLPVSKMSSPHITEEPTNQSHQSTHTSDKGAKILLGKRMKRNSVIEEHDNQVTRGTHKPSFASDSLYMYQPEGVEEEEPTTENEKKSLQDESPDDMTLTELDPNKGEIEDPTVTSIPTPTVMKTSDSKPSNISGAPELDSDKEVIENPVVASMPALTAMNGNVLNPSNISMAPSVYENAFENVVEDSHIDEEQQPQLSGSKPLGPVPSSSKDKEGIEDPVLASKKSTLHDFEDSHEDDEQQPQLSAQTGSKPSVPAPSSSKDKSPTDVTLTKLDPDTEGIEDPIIASHTSPSYQSPIHTNPSQERLPASKQSLSHISEEPPGNQSHQSTHTSEKGAKILLGKRMKRNSVIEEHDNQVTRGTHKPSFASDSLYMYQPGGLEEEEPTTENKK